MTSQHREALASMMYGIRERRGFSTITGEVGTGKTTLIYSLLNNLNEKVKTVFIYHTNITFEELLKTILLELDFKRKAIRNKDKLSLIRKLNTYLIRQLEQDKTVAVIIDEAQNLSKEVMEELRMLSNLETSKTKLLQLLLVGQPELEIKLNSQDLRQLKQRIGIRRQIKPLNDKEIRQYIDHRLHLVGSKTSKVFTMQAVSMICRYSKGIPRNINVICENAFLIGYSLSKKRIDRQIVDEAIDDMSGSSVQNEIQDTNNHTISHFKTPSIAAAVLLAFGTLLFVGTEYIKSESPRKEIMAISEEESVSVPTVYPEEAPEPIEIVKPADNSLVEDTSPDQPEDENENKYNILDIVIPKQGDTVSFLAETYYGAINETLMDIILNANPAIDDVNIIYQNQHIIIPEITIDSFIIKMPDDKYIIHAGTYRSLQYAREFCYDRALKWKDVHILNRRVSDNKIWYKVVASEYETREECVKTLMDLQDRGVLPITF